MKVRILISLAIVVAALAACRSGVPVPPPQSDSAKIERDAHAFIEAMKPRRPGKPVIAVLALNQSTEITDFLLTHAVLQRSGVADVHAVAPQRGRVDLYPALDVQIEQDLDGFDRAFPAGADYVIVPAMSQDNDPAITAWLRTQADKGARIVAVCLGGLVVGQAGLLDGRRFASHWWVREKLTERHPTATYVPNQRYVVDRDVATTTGITASVPAMLALVEAIGGREKAQALAAELGVPAWSPAHDSTEFGVTAGRAVNFLLSKAAFWRNERRSIDVQDGTDDIALALATDAWTRTGHVDVIATSVSASGKVRLRSGLTLLTDPAQPGVARVALAPAAKPVRQLDRTLCEIEERYGTARREWVMQEMEYPGTLEDCAG